MRHRIGRRPFETWFRWQQVHFCLITQHFEVLRGGLFAAASSCNVLISLLMMMGVLLGWTAPHGRAVARHFIHQSSCNIIHLPVLLMLFLIVTRVVSAFMGIGLLAVIAVYCDDRSCAWRLPDFVAGARLVHDISSR